MKSKKELLREHSSYFSRIEICPLGAFKQAQRGDLPALAISGNPSDYELQGALNELNEQYFDIVGTGKHFMEQYRKVYLMKNKVQRVAALFNLSKMTQDDLEEVKKTVRGKTLNDCIAKYKKLNLQLDAELKEIENKNVNSSSDVDYFEELHRCVSEHIKYEIPETITLYGFAVHVKNYLKYIERKKYEKRRNK